MLNDQVKKTIQEGYRAFLKSRNLHPRLGQKQMIATVANTLSNIESDSDGERVSDNGLCVVEAGTGTGKTIGYLLSALPVARQLDKKVVIATGTVSLQEQLVERDIPDLIQATGWNYKIALAKGRGRYLCPLKLELCLDAVASSQNGQFLFPDEITFNSDQKTVQIYEDMGEALASGKWAGDRDSWSEGVDEHTWRPLTIDRRQCAGRRCRHINNCCFFKARDSLDQADIVVANHDLVMSDLALGGGVILSAPEKTIYVFDEGHKLPDIALRHFAANCRLGATATWLQQMDKQLASQAPHFAELESIGLLCEEVAGSAKKAATQLSLITPLFREIFDQLDENAEQLYRFPKGDVGAEVRAAADEVGTSFIILQTRLERLSECLSDLLEEPHSPVPRADTEQLYQVVGTWYGRAENATALWGQLSQTDPHDVTPNARWISLEGSGNLDISVSCSPITAAPMLTERLWQKAFGVVVTSATLQALNKFDRFQEHAGTPESAIYQTVAGAFDYQNAGILAVPVIADAGNQQAHSEDLIKKLPDLVKQDDSSLVLFASRRQMEHVWDGLPLALQKIILVQGDYSNNEIIRRHKKRIDGGKGSAIFGLASFAEGVDLPGDYCNHVIIAKIPFAVPNDPIHEAMSEWIENRGGKPFFETALPDASLKLIQACGRLLRNESDRGRVTILDRRMVTKSYGRQLLNSLPPFRQEIER